MKFLTAAFLLAVSLPSLAWVNIITCDNDSFVIDRQFTSAGAPEYQVVFRGVVTKSMLKQELIKVADINAKKEAIFSLSDFNDSDRGVYGFISSELMFSLGNKQSPFGDSFVISAKYGHAFEIAYMFNNCSYKYVR